MANTLNPTSDTNTATGKAAGAVPNTNGDKMAVDDTMTPDQYSHIPGWGMDADPENDPTYPMKHWNGADHQRLNYEKAPQQPIDIEVFHSIERPSISRVFGTSTPPSGLSGAIRRYAYDNYSEANALHWMTLILADRVNVFEGIIEDLSHGHIPNIFAERGWNAEWKYNKKGVIKELLIGAALITGAIAYSSAKKKRKKAKLLKALKG
jgi:hypothetical protein